MRFINDTVEPVGGLQFAMTEIKLHDVSRQVIRPVLSTGLAEDVNRK